MQSTMPGYIRAKGLGEGAGGRGVGVGDLDR